MAAMVICASIMSPILNCVGSAFKMLVVHISSCV
jgi:hypothetical protein